MSVKPSRTTVISVAAATAVLVAGTAAAGIATSYRHVTVEVDGVTHDVSGFFTTAGDALSTAGVSVGAHAHARGAQGVTGGREEAGHVVGHAVNLDGDVAVGGCDAGGGGACHEDGRRGGDRDDGCAGGLNAHGAPNLVVSAFGALVARTASRGGALSRSGVRSRTDTPTVTNLLPFREHFDATHARPRAPRRPAPASSMGMFPLVMTPPGITTRSRRPPACSLVAGRTPPPR